jgi:sugar lactone lactonase YvrE
VKKRLSRRTFLTTRRHVLLAVFLAIGCTGCDPCGEDGSEALLQDEYSLSSSFSFPEGVAFDPVGRCFYAGSLQGGTITRISADGEECLFSSGNTGLSFTGMKVDADNRRLWVCASRTSLTGSRVGEVWVFDLATGEKLKQFDLRAIADGGRCNDLALDDSGAAYVTDPSQPNIYRLAFDQDAGSLFASSPVLEPEFTLEGVPRSVVPGSNGAALTPDGRFLLVANTFGNTLFRIARDAPQDIVEVQLAGDAFSFPDGLAMLGDVLYAVASSKILRVSFVDETFSQGTVTSIAFESGLSTATVAEGELYVIKSEISAIIEAGMEGRLPIPDLPFKIIRVDLGLFQEN